jgi:hypothetical protein
LLAATGSGRIQRASSLVLASQRIPAIPAATAASAAASVPAS